jgi:hypothetical protein
MLLRHLHTVPPNKKSECPPPTPNPRGSHGEMQVPNYGCCWQVQFSPTMHVNAMVQRP